MSNRFSFFRRESSNNTHRYNSMSNTGSAPVPGLRRKNAMGTFGIRAVECVSLRYYFFLRQRQTAINQIFEKRIRFRDMAISAAIENYKRIQTFRMSARCSWNGSTLNKARNPFGKWKCDREANFPMYNSIINTCVSVEQRRRFRGNTATQLIAIFHSINHSHPVFAVSVRLARFSGINYVIFHIMIWLLLSYPFYAGDVANMAQCLPTADRSRLVLSGWVDESARQTTISTSSVFCIHRIFIAMQRRPWRRRQLPIVDGVASCLTWIKDD